MKSIVAAAAYAAGVWSGFTCYQSANDPAIDGGPHYQDWQRRDLTKQVYWIQYEAKHPQWSNIKWH